MVELILLFMGVYVLFTGRYSVGKGRVVTGGIAIVCGLLLIAPIPLTLLFLVPHIRARTIGYPAPGMFIEMAIVLICWGLSSFIARHSQSQATSDDKVKQIPFSANEILSVSEDDALARLKFESNNHGPLVFAADLGDHWLCICGTDNKNERSLKIQNCSVCMTNRDFALKEWTLDALKEKVARHKNSANIPPH